MNRGKEKISREAKILRAEENWAYKRSGMDERPIDKQVKAQIVKPTVLFDEGQMQRDWINSRFGVEEK